MPELPTPPASLKAAPNLCDRDSDASIRLLLALLVDRLKTHPLELAERAIHNRCDS